MLSVLSVSAVIYCCQLVLSPGRKTYETPRVLLEAQVCQFAERVSVRNATDRHPVLVCRITVTVTLQHDSFDACAMCLAF